jgi:hypothetical protein
MSSRGRRIQVVALAGLVAALTALPAGAEAALIDTGACDDAQLSTPFARWGDLSQYKLAPGGDMNGSLAGWKFTGAARQVGGSEPYGPDGTSGMALSLPAGSSVTTPATCVNASYPSFRLFARSSGGLLGLLPLVKVDLVYHSGLLGIIAVPIGTVLPSSSWTPTLTMLTASAVNGLTANGTMPLSVRFTSLAGTWQIDDVYVDPYSRS